MIRHHSILATPVKFQSGSTFYSTRIDKRILIAPLLLLHPFVDGNSGTRELAFFVLVRRAGS
jgi:hypothetical protein